MTHEDKFRSLNLDDAVRALRDDTPSSEQLHQAANRVWTRLQNQDVAADVEQIRGCADVRLLLPALAAGKLSASRKLLVEDHLRECLACRNVAQTGSAQPVVWEMPKPGAPARPVFPRFPFAFAAAAVVILAAASLFIASYLQTPSGPRATLQSARGAIYRVTSTGTQPIAPGAELNDGELVRTSGGAHAFVQLRDGSIVEMSERSEFSVSASRRDTTVHLDQGRVIVQAAHRRTGHLYVLTPDAKVAVTGTVFAVNTGLKGSRVSVIEGAVRVSYNGADDLLHSGDQANTTSNLSSVPVSDDISWSDNLDKHLALLAEFSKLKQAFEQIPMPGMRYSSAVLDKLPSNTVFYASIPNLGDALNQANDIFQNELQQSSVLRDWWAGKTTTSTSTTTHPTFDQMVQKLHGMTQYLGDEIVVAGFVGPDSGSNGVVVIAPVKNSGLKQYLDTEFTNLVTHDGQTGGLNVISEDQLNAATSVPGHQLTAVVGDQFVMISPNLATLRLMSNQLKSSGGFSQTPFGQRLADAYNRGAGLLFGADFKSILAANQARNPGVQQSAAYQASGFSDMDYLLVEHHNVNNVPDNRAVLTFTGQRRGMVSWLAAPNPIGSLQFVSANAGAAASFLSKDPALIFDDMMQLTGASAGTGLTDTEAKLNLSIRNDIAAQLGGDVTLALDGPVLPKPSWKVILQVNNSGTLQYSIGKLMGAINSEAALHQEPGVELTSEVVDGRTYYRIRPLNPKALGMEVDYTFSDGYMIAAPSRALVQEALHTKDSGDTLPASTTFQGLLPKDGHVNFSALLYQNLGPLLQPLASQLTSQQMQALQQIASGSKPTVICAYASGDRIEVASGSDLLPVDLNSLSIATLLGARHGTSAQ